MSTMDQNQVNSPRRTRIQRMLHIGVPFVLLLLASIACGARSPFSTRCRAEGGYAETRLAPDGDRSAYCVFADGTECAFSMRGETCWWLIEEGWPVDTTSPFMLFGFQRIVTTTPDPFASPTPTTPASPLSTPSPASPLATPNAPVSPLAAPAPESPLPLPEVQYNPPVSSFMRAPGSLDALLRRAPLIFIGEVGPVERYTEFVPIERAQPTIDAEGNAVPGVPVINTLLAGMPMTEFQLIVDEVIRDDGTIAAGEPVILRSTGHVTASVAQASRQWPIPHSFTGDRYLFLLTPYPDGKAYAFYYNAWSRLIVEGNDLYISNGDRDPLVFDESDGPVTLDLLIQALQGD